MPPAAGHYVAYVKLPDELWWWRCDDEVVKALEETDALGLTEDGKTAVPYLLFYVRKAAN
jgi:ubiquitin C-terminal hydrolase